MTTATETGLFNVHTEDIQFPGGFSDDVSPLRSNKGMPVIVLETEDGYRLIDGWGRVSGLLNAGAEAGHRQSASVLTIWQNAQQPATTKSGMPRCMHATHAQYTYRRHDELTTQAPPIGGGAIFLGARP
jgi:hypothetical protein